MPGTTSMRELAAGAIGETRSQPLYREDAWAQAKERAPATSSRSTVGFRGPSRGSVASARPSREPALLSKAIAMSAVVDFQRDVTGAAEERRHGLGIVALGIHGRRLD